LLRKIVGKCLGIVLAKKASKGEMPHQMEGFQKKGCRICWCAEQDPEVVAADRTQWRDVLALLVSWYQVARMDGSWFLTNILHGCM